ncbi:hypothetical protein FOA52_011253 [Chlamydomonas sp. UWO 241]|nr:hypothetical protein FOA52_011253 [Chlamydomonas sp. UWO 241]
MEAMLAAWVMKMYKINLTPTTDQIATRGRRLMQLSSLVSVPLPSRYWVTAFCGRNYLSVRKAAGLDTQRLLAAGDVAQITARLEDLEQVYNMVCVPEVIEDRAKGLIGRPALRFRDCPHRIYNDDEAGLQHASARHGRRFVAPKGVKMPYIPCECNRESVTMLCWGNATGECMSPIFIWQGKTYPQNYLANTASSGFTPACRAKQDSHMMDGRVWVGCLAWMATQIKGGVSPTNKVLLIVDGHTSRLTCEGVDEARAVGFEVMVLPGHCTHFVQPWDKVFGAFRKKYEDLYVAAALTRKGSFTLSKLMWLSLVCSALRNMVDDTPNIHKGAWKKTGLWPLDKVVVLAAARGASSAAEAWLTKPVVEVTDADVLAILTIPMDRTGQQLAAARVAPVRKIRQLLRITCCITSDEIAAQRLATPPASPPPGS